MTGSAGQNGRGRRTSRLPAPWFEPDRAQQVAQDAASSLPGLARVAASAAWHTTEWGVRTSARTWLRVGRAVTDRDEARALARDAGYAAAVAGDLARSVSEGTPLGKALIAAGASFGGLVPDAPVGSHLSDGEEDDERKRVVDGQVVTSRDEPASLRERGQELLRRSRDVWLEDEGHPAYDRILEELAPDEARILLLLVHKGPQPSVDVRTGGPIGMVSSQLVAPGLTMIGPRAGCRYVEHVPAYLNNLFRLGLVWFSRESLRDPMEYQVVEAQPDVLVAVHSVRFAKMIRRSIHLTPFGEGFCRTCLVEEDAAALTYPGHGTPGEGESLAPL